MHLPITAIAFNELKADMLTEQAVEVTIVRLDKIHQQVSGNKLFKLHYFVEHCLASQHKTILTFGGTYSNHLVATAFLCKEKGIKCIGIIRGEEPKIVSHTLEKCKALGMHLYFISRATYKNIDAGETVQQLKDNFGNFTMVPEGGYHKDGARGAALIMNFLKDKAATHICTCVGTATTLAGLLLNNSPAQEIIAIPIIKNMEDINERIKFLTDEDVPSKLTVFNEYHFGGYAKYNPTLIAFMNDFFTKYQIPTDFVYTAKMMYGIMDKIAAGYFKKGSHIFCLHTGGLQGNDSLPKETLIF
jgi:1-aminocyclopropane-1-carboxylate deaminase